MDGVNFAILLCDLIGIALSCSAIWVGRQTRVNNFIVAYAIFFVVFVQALELVQTSETTIRSNIPLRLFTDCICALHLFLIVAFAWLVPSVAIGERATKVLMATPDSLWRKGLWTWIAIKAYLITRYGTDALAPLQAIASGAGTEGVFSYSDFIINSIASAIFFGSLLIFLAKAVGNPASVKRRAWLFAGSIFLIYVFSGEALEGGRRTLAIIAIVAISIYAGVRNISFVEVAFREWRKIVLAAVLVVGASAYYQTVRNNAFDPNFVSAIRFGTFADKAEAAAGLFIPSTTEYLSGDTFFRAGPYTVLYDICERSFVEGRTSGGRLTEFAVEKAFPKAIFPDKPDGDIDALMTDEMDLRPSKLATAIDLAPTDISILIADFGISGLFLGTLVSFLPLAFFLWMVFVFRRKYPLVLLSGGYLLTMVSNVEAAPTTAITSIRDFVLCAAIYLVLEPMVRFVLSIEKIPAAQ